MKRHARQSPADLCICGHTRSSHFEEPAPVVVGAPVACLAAPCLCPAFEEAAYEPGR